VTADWDNELTDDLVRTLRSLPTADATKQFLRDLLTEAEMREFGLRWRVAVMLEQEVPYSEIERSTGMSSATIARISKWLKTGTGGYRLALKRRKQAPVKRPRAVR
jgi:TrpR-related protein YerC/YecD